MKDIRKPAFMQKAAQGKPGHIAIIEILLAVAVFGVCFVAMGIVQFPLLFLEMMSNQKYMDLILQGDQQSMQEAMELSMDITANLPEWIMILILLSEILMILVVILYCRIFEKRKADTMGFRKKGMIGWYVAGMLGGFFFFTVAYLFCTLTGSIHFDGMADHVAPLYIIGYLAGYMVQGMAEEVLCRGYLFVSLTRRHPLWYSALLSAVFFAALHGMNPGLSVLAVLNLILFGVFAALLLVKYENIWIVGAFHSIWNFVQGNLYGIQVSGNSLQQSVFASTCNRSQSFINGGTFGMEGGLAVTLVLGAGVAYLLWSLQREGKIVESGTNFPVSAMSGSSYEMPHGNV
ncbi:MAG: CPBP family intramembrane metalloprotease, partial [Lachnospiraceae bacterium]|nr:CPBP family intramembrane metalloprotease [Lachnospiraceae bacterium]